MATERFIRQVVTEAGELVCWVPSTVESGPRPGGKFTYKFLCEVLEHNRP